MKRGMTIGAGHAATPDAEGRMIAAELIELLRAVDRPMCLLHLPLKPAAICVSDDAGTRG